MPPIAKIGGGSSSSSCSFIPILPDTGEFIPGGRFKSVKAAVHEVYDVWNKKYSGCAYSIYAVNNNYLPYREMTICVATSSLPRCS
jgi:hypothetical protein